MLRRRPAYLYGIGSPCTTFAAESYGCDSVAILVRSTRQGPWRESCLVGQAILTTPFTRLRPVQVHAIFWVRDVVTPDHQDRPKDDCSKIVGSKAIGDYAFKIDAQSRRVRRSR